LIQSSITITDLIFRGRNKLLFVATLCLMCARALAFDPDPSQLAADQQEAMRRANEWSRESTNMAIAILRRTASRWEELGEAGNAVTCLIEAAKLYPLDEHEPSRELLEQAVELSRRSHLTAELVKSYSLLSLKSLERGDLAEAESNSRAASRLSGSVSDGTAKAYAHLAAGMIDYYYGTIARAIERLEQAEAVAPQSSDPWLTNQIFLYHGFARLRNAQPVEAENKINQAITQSEALGYEKGRALAYAGLGYVFYSVSNWQKALDSFGKAEESYPDDFEIVERARVLSLMGEIYLHHAYLELAQRNLEQAVSIYENAGYDFGKAGSLRYLAEVYLEAKEIEKARATFAQARSLAVKLDDVYLLADISEGIGNVESASGNHSSAVASYREAIQTYKSVGVSIPSVEALLGDAYNDLGNRVAARKYYLSAIQASEKTRNTMVLSETLYRLARLDLQEERFAEALAGARRSVELTELLYSEVANFKIKRSYLSAAYERFELLTHLEMREFERSGNNDAARRALVTAEASRTRSLLHALRISGADFVADADPAVLRTEADIRMTLNAKSDALTDLLARRVAAPEAESLQGEITLLEHRLAEISAKLRAESPVYASVKNPPPLSVEDLQKTVLDENSVLLEYSLGEDASYLWVVTSDQFEAFQLPPRNLIEGRIRDLRGLVSARKPVVGESFEQLQTRVSASDASYPQLARELSTLLLGPAVSRLAGKRLIIVPDGAIHEFPLSALPMPYADSDDPILLSNEVVYQPSARTLGLLANPRNIRSVPTKKTLLALSDPVFRRDDTRLSPAIDQDPVKIDAAFSLADSLDGLERLPASGIETRAISEIVGGPHDVFSDFEATRENFLNSNLSDYMIIHLATHGLVDQERPERSAVILSRFDRQGGRINESIRLRDIYAMKLNADLVVLSACKTAAGKEIKGEGVMGLNSAFLQAGARSVVASLWQVEDNATNQLMREFYGGVARGLTVSAALREAQLALYRDPQFRSPFYWAAFTLQGDMNRRPDIGASIYGRVVLIVIPVIGALVAALLLWRRFGGRLRQTSAVAHSTEKL
jgi:CHAT domain-containing protein/tetratricopeptide (TPR) repeat protein